MKKVALSFIALALVALSAFADDVKPGITFGAWGRAMAFPVYTVNAKDGIIGSGATGTSWGSSPRVGFSVIGNSANAGFEIHMANDSTTGFGNTDNNQLWVKPFDGLKLIIGNNLFIDDLRGNANMADWDWLRFSWSGEDMIFGRVVAQSALEYQNGPITAYVATANGANGASVATYWDTGKALIYGAGYAIDGVGLIRAQGIGQGAGENYYTLFNVAMKVTAVKNLYADFGVKVPSKNDSKTANFNFEGDAYAAYTIDKAKVSALVQVVNYANSGKTNTDGFGFEGALGLDYDLGSSITAQGEFRYVNALKKDNGAAVQNDAKSVLVGITKGFSNGVVGIAFEYSTNVFAANYLVTTEDKTVGRFAIPVKAEYWF